MFNRTISLIELRVATLIAIRNSEDKRKKWGKGEVERLDEHIKEYKSAIEYLKKATVKEKP